MSRLSTKESLESKAKGMLFRALSSLGSVDFTFFEMFYSGAWNSLINVLGISFCCFEEKVWRGKVVEGEMSGADKNDSGVRP